MKRIAIVNGPNINLLGRREVDIYGTKCWDEIERPLLRLADSLRLQLVVYQSNHEGDIVDFLQQEMDTLDGVIINPASFSKGGYSILDALSAREIPYVEVHLSNIAKRGEWHAESVFTKKAIGLITGFQHNVYELGLRGIWAYLESVKNVPSYQPND